MAKHFSIKEIDALHRSADTLLRAVSHINRRWDKLIKDQDQIKAAINNLNGLYQAEADMICRYLTLDKTAKKSETLYRRLQQYRDDPRVTMLSDELNALIERLQQGKHPDVKHLPHTEQDD